MAKTVLSQEVAQEGFQRENCNPLLTFSKAFTKKLSPGDETSD